MLVYLLLLMFTRAGKGVVCLICLGEHESVTFFWLSPCKMYWIVGSVFTEISCLCYMSRMKAYVVSVPHENMGGGANSLETFVS